MSKHLMIITLYKLSQDELEEFNAKVRDGENPFYWEPKWYVDESGEVIPADGNLPDDKKEPLYLFDVDYMDNFLEDYTREVGFMDVLGIGLLPFFEKLPCTTFQELTSEFQSVSVPIVMEFHYSESFNGETTEYDAELWIAGHLDENLEFVEYKP